MNRNAIFHEVDMAQGYHEVEGHAISDDPSAEYFQDGYLTLSWE